MNIHELKPGSIITRIEPCIERREEYSRNLGLSTVVDGKKDESYIGEPLRLIDVKNEAIYFEILSGPIKGNIVTLPLFRWAEGWAPFKMPEGLTLEDL